MADIKLNVKGMDGLIDGLQAAQAGTPRKVADAVDRTTTAGTRIAKIEAPVDTGRLEAEIYGVSTALTGLIVSPTEYARWVNWGTSRQAPNEYMGRAAAAIEPLLADEVRKAALPEL